MTLNRKALLALKVDCPTETVEVPVWGASVIVKGMDARELTAFQKSIEMPGKRPGEVQIDEETLSHKLIVRCLVDDKGHRLLKDEEYKFVQEWPAAAFQKIHHAALRVNGMTSEGNSAPTRDGGSSSA